MTERVDHKLTQDTVYRFECIDKVGVQTGCYTKVVHVESGVWTNVVGHIIHDRTSPDYQMKNDKHRIQTVPFKATRT